jgi:hypothetical protein
MMILTVNYMMMMMMISEPLRHDLIHQLLTAEENMIGSISNA